MAGIGSFLVSLMVNWYNDIEVLEWLDKELNGYWNIRVSDLPHYRKIYGSADVLHVGNPWKPVQFHSEEQKKSYTYTPNAEPLASIEYLLTKLMIVFDHEDAKREIREGMGYSQQVEDIRIKISPTSLRNILHVVRNRIFEWSSTLPN